MGEETLDASVTDAMKASQEAQEMATASLQKLSSQYGMDNISGTDAAKVLQQYDDRQKEAMKLVRKNYGDDIRGFDKFMLAYGAKIESERRSLAKMCGAEMRHGLGVAVKTDTEKRFADIEHRDILDGASVTAGQAVANEEASEAFHSRLDEIDSEAEEAKNRAKQDYEKAIAQEGADKAKLEAEYKAKIAAIDSATSISRGATAGESVDALKKIKGMESSNAASKAKPLRDDFRNIFIQRLKAEGADCLGHSPEIAMANALQATRSGVIGYFTNRIKSGQVAAVLATLDELEKLGDEDFEASKAKSPTGVYDPSAYGFLRKSDIIALRKAATEEINSFERMSKLQMSIEKAKHDIQQDRLEQAANIWKGDVRLKISRGELSTMSSPEEMLSQFLPEIKKFQDAGYEKVDELVSSITAACNGFFKLRDDTQKRYSSMSRSVRQADFARRIEDYRLSEADNVAMTYVLPNGKIARSDAVDRRAALVAFIDVALRDETIDDGAKAAYNDEKKELQAERVKRNANALGILASRCGWRLPTEQTKNVANYRTGMYMEIEGMPSRQTGDTLLFSDNGIPVISNEMTATWTDPENPSLTMTLGASEVRDLFRNAMNTLDQTPEDDLSVLTSSKGGVKSRVEVAFLNALRTAAREKNSKDVYSSLSGAIRMMDRSLFSPSVRTSTRRMDYLHRNAFIPPIVVKKKDDAKKSGK